ncbi:MAG: hypothetical protein M1833_006202 [Piccolia ochrophora]|nr:MAG: hypothetical protein M1833_006202 [Piccolia ochrophora]
MSSARMMGDSEIHKGPESPYDSPTFTLDMSIRVDQPVGSMSISPCGRDVVLASRQGLHIIDLDSPYSPPRHLPHSTPWEVADVQWSPFAARDYWVISTSNQKALVWNLGMKNPANSIEYVLHGHTRAITDINFSAHHPDILATCAVDSFVHCWDLRTPESPIMTFCDWFAGATQVKWNRLDQHIIASSHDKFLRIWDDRKGAYPLRSIEAHDTKIYGVDWNRSYANRVVTCSLDKSIKFWDYEDPTDVPERTIRTPFPVWRARHTPCGTGMLAMPQRENTEVHLYDRRLGEGLGKEEAVPPVHTFEGHQDQVKEFLWRPRGTIENNIDFREFQLVTWGADKDLRLHRLDEDILEKIGYKKGQEVSKKFNFTRKNAVYRTFSEEPSPNSRSRFQPDSTQTKASGVTLEGALTASMRKAPIPLSGGWGEGTNMSSQSSMQAKRNAKTEISSIDWMKGVKIGKRAPGQENHNHNEIDGPLSPAMSPTLRSSKTWERPESLGDEITQVADKFSKVTFESVNIPKRTATISVNGPWGHDGAVVYVKVDVEFPESYPERSPPSFRYEKTSSIPMEIFSKAREGVQLIAAVYALKGKSCLEAIVQYLLGEQDVNQSTTWLLDVADETGIVGHDAEQFSSDDEDGDGQVMGRADADDMETSGADLGTMTSNTNVPLPKACGAIFAPNGRLVCFFPPKEDRFRVGQGWGMGGSWDRKAFARFGRLQTGAADPTTKMFATDEDLQEDYDSADDSFTSSSNSSTSSGESVLGPGNYGFPIWRRELKHSRISQAKSTDFSQRSTGAGSTSLKGASTASKNIISIYDLDNILPSQKRLAKDYIIFGDGLEVCRHNAMVAEGFGFGDIADLWRLAELLLYNQIPLRTLDQHHRREPILVVARRAADTLRRRDSGLDLAFDEPDELNVDFSGRVKWGQHPLAGAWLLKAIQLTGTSFEYFEQKADVQMLAMLSCLFSEPAAKGGATNAVSNLNQRELPMSMKSPAFSLEYFPSADVAWSLYQPTLSIVSTPKISHTPIGTYGSAESSNGQWGSDPVTPYSTGMTPPLTYKSSRWSAEHIDNQPRSLSTSPEHHHGRRSNTSLTSAFAASLSRGFSTVASSSPPSKSGKKSVSPVDHAIGNMGAGGITWGTNTVFGPSIKEPLTSGSAAYTESDIEDDDTQGGDALNVKVTMKNQTRFDMENHSSIPLLDPNHSVRYRGYRENYANLLDAWGLDMRRLEILKFNGLRSYFPDNLSTHALITLGKKQSSNLSSQWTGLAIVGHCSICTHLVRRKSSEGNSSAQLKCSACASVQDKMSCAICNESLRGTYAPCLTCGHVLHAHCHREWFGGEEPGRAACPTGCGCRCTEAALRTVEVRFDDDHGGAKHVPPLPDREKKLSPVAERREEGEPGEGWEHVGVSGLGRGLGGGLSRGLVEGERAGMAPAGLVRTRSFGPYL